jgi:hypothetical protein
MSIPGGAVARQIDPLPEWNDQPHFMQIAAGKVQGIDEVIARVAQVGNGSRVKAPRGEDGVVVPALLPEALQPAQAVEARLFQVAVEQWLAAPACLGQATGVIQ